MFKFYLNSTFLSSSHRSWKQLAGTVVLKSGYSSHDDPARVQAGWDSRIWCGKDGTGTVLVSYINVMSTAVALALGADIATEVAMSPRTEFFLTSSAASPADRDARHDGDPPASITADAAFLNGAPLQARPDGTLPQFPLPGREVPRGSRAPAVVPPWSYGFVLLPVVGDKTRALCGGSGAKPGALQEAARRAARRTQP